MHHGLANALCLPAVLDFNRSAIPGKLATLARLFGVRADDEESLAFECSGAESALSKLSELAIGDVCHQENPRPCTRDDLLKMYQASF